jgi:O-antigen ligase
VSAQAATLPRLVVQAGGRYTVLAVAGLVVVTGRLLHSAPLVAVALVPLVIWTVLRAPEVLLVLLATQGAIKSLPFFAETPVNLLYVSLGLVGIACALRIRSQGLPPFAVSSTALIVLLIVLLLFAALTSPIPGATYKAVYFEIVCGTLFFASLILVRDGPGLARLATGFVIVGLVVAQAAVPGGIPNEPYTLPGGNEITAAYFPAMGALAALSCLAMRTFGLRRVALLALAGLLTVAAVRAGSRGVLAAGSVAMCLALVLLVFRSRRRVLALGAAVLVAVGSLVVVPAFIETSALQRYSGGLTNDPRRDYLRTHAIEQALNHPMGLGIGGFGRNLPVISLPTVPYPHNVVLEVWNESGLLGLDALLLLVAAVFVLALKLAGRPGFAFCGAGLAFAFVEALASGNVNDNKVLWLMLGVTCAAWRMPGPRAAGSPSAP